MLLPDELVESFGSNFRRKRLHGGSIRFQKIFHTCTAKPTYYNGPMSTKAIVIGVIILIIIAVGAYFLMKGPAAIQQPAAQQQQAAAAAATSSFGSKTSSICMIFIFVPNAPKKWAISQAT